jgi:hypothetical protein
VYLGQELVVFVRTSKGPKLLHGDDFAVVELASVHLACPPNADEMIIRKFLGCLLQLHIGKPENNTRKWTFFSLANLWAATQKPCR